MHCPSCHAEDTRVIDSRVIDNGSAIRRRRACSHCPFRFTTLEEIEILTLAVVKMDGHQEPYDKEKLIRSLSLPLQKRPITPARFKHTLHDIEEEIQAHARKDTITTRQIGDIVMKHLKKLDKVAYIRFASVYRSFADVNEFADELEKLSHKKKSKKS